MHIIRGSARTCNLKTSLRGPKYEKTRTPGAETENKTIAYELVADHEEHQLRKVKLLRRDWKDYERIADTLDHEQCYVFFKHASIRIV